MNGITWVQTPASPRLWINPILETTESCTASLAGAAMTHGFPGGDPLVVHMIGYFDVRIAIYRWLIPQKYFRPPMNEPGFILVADWKMLVTDQ